MSRRTVDLDFLALQRDGYAVLPGLVRAGELDRFERDIAALGTTLARRRGVDAGMREPIVAVLEAAGAHRAMLFEHIKHLYVLERLSGEIAAALEDAGLFRTIGVPAAWPTLRADLPGERTYTFPLHQDYATTRCATAWRLWVPLRAVDEHHGSMAVVAGSHRGAPYAYVTENTSYPHVAAEEIARRGLRLTNLALPAGDGVIFDPNLVHGSIPNQSQRTKWVLLMHVQDLATFVDPDDADDPLQQFLELTRRQRAAQAKAR